MTLTRPAALALTWGLLLLATPGAAAPAAPVAPAASATSGGALEIAGALPRPGSISLAELKKLPLTKAPWAGGGGRVVTGVALDVLLAKQGFDRGVMGKEIAPREKRRGWHKVVVATARDGFVAVLSCAEVFEDMGATRALVVWELDGKPLPADKGPLRLVVLTDKEPSRSLYALSRIDVVDLTPSLTSSPGVPGKP
jgi:DMSO/TMAO reductase YedYZ molybdopterin-dependent catalytic subunit